jgi:hypothetical protein
MIRDYHNTTAPVETETGGTDADGRVHLYGPWYAR